MLRVYESCRHSCLFPPKLRIVSTIVSLSTRRILYRSTYYHAVNTMSISPIADHETAKALEAAISDQLGRVQRADFDARDLPERIATRRQLFEPNDPLALERVIGERDLMAIGFLARGAKAARAVCRIRIRDRFGNPQGFGTGFLAAPGLLLTNHHVLPNRDTAAHSIAEFDYELDESFVPRQVRQFALTPETMFFADGLYDFAFVAVSAFGHDDAPLANFGHLQLLPRSGKAISGERVTIVQHPNGEPKQIVIRGSQIVALRPDQEAADSAFVHYTSDTEPGASGAPVLSDRWDVVALHHKAVPKYDDDGNIQSVDGDDWQPSMGEHRIHWIANEGVRVSAIYKALRRVAARDAEARKVLHRLTSGAPTDHRFPRVTVPGPVDDAGEADPFEASRFDGAAGYVPGFLGFAIPLPSVVGAWAGDVAELIDGGTELKYRNFSIVMSKSRRLAFLTAVNIDGGKLQRPTKSPSWRRDPRLDKALQSDNVLYKNDPAEEFDLQRGHLVRRLDPVWGDTQDEVNEAVNHTYHYTNAAPQEGGFNNTVWGDLEDFILARAIDTDHRVTVFSGPIFDDFEDPFYRHTAEGGPYQIPLRFWKVVAFKRPDNTPSASAYIQSQPDVVSTHEAALTTHGFDPLSEQERIAAQLRIADLEELTLIDFGALKESDTMAGIESTIRKRPIFGPEDMLL